MKLLAIDPGNEMSAYCIYDTLANEPTGKRKITNAEMLEVIDAYGDIPMAIEMIACYGMAVGKTVFETCVWIGRFIQAHGENYEYVYRREVKMFLCNSMIAKDSNVRQAIIDRFPAIGGGKTPQIGTKAQPGPLYGFAADMWAALGVALTYAEKQKRLEIKNAVMNW